MSDSTPTERFDSPIARAPRGDGPPPKTLVYVLIGVGALLIIAIVVLILTLQARPGSLVAQSSPTATATGMNSPTPVFSETAVSPSPVPEPVQTEAPPPPPPPPPADPVPGFDSFSAPTDAGCEAGDTARELTFSWASDDAVRAYIGVQTKNAKSAPYEGDLPPVYTYALNYQCDLSSQFYTVTLEDGAGHLTHKTVTISK
jgi:hypothetical protein